MKLTALCGVAAALSMAGCGSEESRAPDAAPPESAQATVTPEPTPEKPKLQGRRLRDTTIDDMVEVAGALREQVGELFERAGQPSKIEWTGCDRVHEGTLTMACFLRAADGFEEVVIVWGDAETRDAVGYKAYSGLTCGEREQGLARRQAEALARLTHPQTRNLPNRPTKAKIQREMKREFDRRCAKGSARTVPGNKAVVAVVGPLVKVRRR